MGEEGCFINNLQPETIYICLTGVGQYRFDFRSNNPNLSTGNDLKHVANVSGRRGSLIFL